MKPQAFIFIGRAGCGKGTQAALLIDVLKKREPGRQMLYIETGKEFRKFMEEDNHTARMTKEVLSRGELMPEFMSVYIWGRLLVERYTGKEHLVFDGTPRKFMEAKVFDSVFPFYSIEKPWVIYINVEDGESTKRLRLRGRYDDDDEDVKKRLAWFETEVRPTVDYYRSNQDFRFLDVNGERSIEDIHKDLMGRLGLS